MSELAKNTCNICDANVNMFNRLKLKNGEIICDNCHKKTKLGMGWTKKDIQILNTEDIKVRQSEVLERLKENTIRVQQFQATTKAGNHILFDDNNKWFVIPHKNKISESYIFEYKEILAFEVLEDGSTVSRGGLGKALIGGAIFGLAGAIVGGTSKKNKPMCDKLEIKITTRNPDYPVLYINFINSPTKKSSFVYKTIFKNVQGILSKFQIIMDELNAEKENLKEEKEDKRFQSIGSNQNTLSVADEIKKLKELLDIEAITQEEFDAQKTKLLNQ